MNYLQPISLQKFPQLSNKKKIERPGAIVTKLGLCLVAGTKVTQEVRFVM